MTRHVSPSSSSGVSRQAQREAAEESEHQRELVPVLSRDGGHPAVHHRAGQRPAALRLQGRRPDVTFSRRLFVQFLTRLFVFQNGTMSKMSKFEIELPVVPKPAKLSLSERDIAMATM